MPKMFILIRWITSDNLAFNNLHEENGLLDSADIQNVVV